MTKPRRRTFGFWTMARRVALLKLIEQKNTHSECAAILGSTIAGVENVLRRMRKERGETIPARKGNNNRGLGTARKQAVAAQGRIDRLHQPPPASITAWLLGDPLPGRSALDRKRLGIADEVIIESHTGVRTNRITLAMEPMRCDI